MARLWLWEASEYETIAGSLLANYIVPLVSRRVMSSLQRPQRGEQDKKIIDIVDMNEQPIRNKLRILQRRKVWTLSPLQDTSQTNRTLVLDALFLLEPASFLQRYCFEGMIQKLVISDTALIRKPNRFITVIKRQLDRSCVAYSKNTRSFL